MNNLKGILYVAIGAASYGILATFVKLANNLGYGSAGITFSQYLFGALVLSLWAKFIPNKNAKPNPQIKTDLNPQFKLFFYGSSLGLTSSFYYLSVQYVPVSVSIILLMQSIWMGLVVEYFRTPQLITKYKVLGGMVAIIGTLLAAKLFESNLQINILGLVYGLLAALSFSAVIYATNNVAVHLPSIVRSQYLVYGGLITVILFWNVEILAEFNLDVFIKWGAFLGLFGTIIPPILFNKGFPITGTGLGSIVASLEIPISVVSASLILHENISSLQWIGIFTILFSVVIINLKKSKPNG